MLYTVYLRTNLINGKQYVGQTKNFENRERGWKCLKYRYANKFIQIDREKYGIDNWKTEKLAEVDNREEAWELEEKYIRQFNTKFPNGYNKAYGGKTNKGGNEGYHNGKEFEKGHTPWNKGKKGIHLSQKTEFKPKPIIQLKNGEAIKVWNSIKDAADNVPKANTSPISKCCRGIAKTCAGYQWMYKEDYDEMLASQSNLNELCSLGT